MELVESLHSAMQRGGMPTLVNILHQLLAEQDLMPKHSTSEAAQDELRQEATGGDATKSTDWQPLGIQVAHTLMALCIYPQSSQSTSFPHSGSNRGSVEVNSNKGLVGRVPKNSHHDCHHDHEAGETPKKKRPSLSSTALALGLEKCLDEKRDTEELDLNTLNKYMDASVMGGTKHKKGRKRGSVAIYGFGDSKPPTKEDTDAARQSDVSTNGGKVFGSLLSGTSHFISRTFEDISVRAGRAPKNPVKSVKITLSTDRPSGTILENEEAEPGSPFHRILEQQDVPGLLPDNRKSTDTNSDKRGTSAELNRKSKDNNGMPYPSKKSETRRAMSGGSNNNDAEMIHPSMGSDSERRFSNPEEFLDVEDDDVSHSSNASEEFLKERRSVDVNLAKSKMRYMNSKKSFKMSKVMGVNEEILRNQNIQKLADDKEKQTAEEMKKKETPTVWWLMHPASTTHWCWDVFMTVNLIYVLLFAPINVCFTTGMFQYPNWGWAIDFSVNLFFCVDIVVNFITGVYIEDHDGDESSCDESSQSSDISDSYSQTEERFLKKDMVLSYALKDIWLEYIGSWFVIDVLTVLPWDILLVNLVSDNMDVGAASKLAKLMRLARLIKLLKLHRLRKFMSFLHRNVPLTVLELTKMFLGMCIVSHYVACGFFFVALMTNETGEGTWLEAYLAVPDAINTYAASDLYLNSIYWGFTTVTSVGYGDILPVTNAEKAYALFVMYLGLGMISAITGKLTAVLAKFNAEEAIMQAHISSVKSYCQYRELPREIRANVLQYFEVRAAQKAVCDEQGILSEMSPSLKAQVVCYIFDEVIQSVPFFRGCSDLFLSAVLCCMEPFLFAPADIIIQKGQRELAMYVISKGAAAVVSNYGKIIRELSEGTSVGEIGLLFGVRRTATVCSITFCDTFKLVQDKFLEVQQMYPDMQQHIEAQAEKMFNENMSCYICGSVGHVCIQCPHYASHPANTMDDEADVDNRRNQRESARASVTAWIRKSFLGTLERDSTVTEN